jgi:hypothetical protein
MLVLWRGSTASSTGAHRRSSLHIAIACLVTSIALIYDAPAALALDCRSPAKPGLASDLLSGPEIPSVAALDDPTRLNDFIASSRAAGLSDTDTVDRIVFSYCIDVAARPALSHAEQVRLVRGFAEEVTAQTNQIASERAILVDIPLSPDILAQVDAAAKQTGLTRTAWINRAVLRDLKPE